MDRATEARKRRRWTDAAFYVMALAVVGLLVASFWLQWQTAHNIQTEALARAQANTALLNEIRADLNVHASASANRQCATEKSIRFLVSQSPQIEQSILNKLDEFVRSACKVVLVVDAPPPPETETQQVPGDGSGEPGGANDPQAGQQPTDAPGTTPEPSQGPGVVNPPDPPRPPDPPDPGDPPLPSVTLPPLPTPSLPNPLGADFREEPTLMDSTVETVMLVIAAVLCIGGAFVCGTDKKWPETAIGLGAGLTALVLLFN